MTDLLLRGVRYDAPARTLLDGIDLQLRAGRMTALSGPSGSGKTTLLSVAGGLVRPSAGQATYAGQPMWRGTGDPRPEVAFVLQVYGLVPILSARENVSVALRARGVDPDDADAQAADALARFHIADLGDRQVEELSGGQMQRVALARGLCVGAPVLLADEPTSELDEGNRGLVLAELRREADRGAVVVVATHDPAVVDACDDHHALDEGRLVARTEPVHLPAGTPGPDAGPARQPDPGRDPEPEPGRAAAPAPQPRHRQEQRFGRPVEEPDADPDDGRQDDPYALFRRPTT